MVRRKIHRIHEEEEIHRGAARHCHRPIRREEKRRAHHGRHHHLRRHTRARAPLRPHAQHLPAAHDCHHRLARLPRIHRRLYQELQEKQGRTETLLQTHRTGAARPPGGHHAMGQPRRTHQREHRHGASRWQDNHHLQVGTREVDHHHHPIREKPQPRLYEGMWIHGQIQAGGRMDPLRHRHHTRGDGSEQRSQPERRHGRNVRRQFGHHRLGTGHTRLREQPHRVRILPQHHVHTRITRAGGVLVRIHRSHDRIPVV